MSDWDAPAAPIGALGPAPTDPQGFDAWARLGFDTWRQAAVLLEASRLWDDPATPAPLRIVAGMWANTTGRPTGAELAAVVDDPAVDPPLRARLQVAVAAGLVGQQPEEAVRLAEEAVGSEALADNDVRSRLSARRTASEVLVATGRLDRAAALLERARADVESAPDAPDWALPALEVDRLTMLLRSSTPPEVALAQARTAAGVVLAAGPGPVTAALAMRVAGVLFELGAPAESIPLLRGAATVLDGVEEAHPMRFQALLALADARLAVEGVDAAIETQQEAIAHVVGFGPTPMLGWALRGLAYQLRHAGRNEEALPRIAEAVEILTAGGRTDDVAMLRLEGARAELELETAGSTESAAAVAAELLADLEAVGSELRATVEVQATEVAAQAAERLGALDEAIEAWLRVADLMGDESGPAGAARAAAAEVLAQTGDLDAALALFDRAELQAIEEAEPDRWLSLVLGRRAGVLWDADRNEEAAELARLAASHARTADELLPAIQFTVLAADALDDAGDLGGSAAALEDALVDAETLALPSVVADLHGRLASVFEALGRTEEGEAHARAAEPGD